MGINDLGTHQIYDGQGVILYGKGTCDRVKTKLEQDLLRNFYVSVPKSEEYASEYAILNMNDAYFSDVDAGDEIRFGFVPRGGGDLLADVVIIDEVVLRTHREDGDYD